MTPVFEDTALFARTAGETSDVVSKEMYTFHDRSDRSLTLRPEGTAPVVRAYLEHGLAREPQPVRFWYFAPMYRYAAPQAGRYREHWQFGVEAIGSDDPAVDAEVIAVQAAWYRALGTRPDLELHLNSIGDPACRPAYREALVAYLEPLRDQLSPESQERLERNPMRILDSKDERDQALVTDAPRISQLPVRGVPRRTSRRCARTSRRAGSSTSSTMRSCAGSTTTPGRPGSSSRSRTGARRRRSRAAAATTASPSRSAASGRRASASAAASSGSCSRSRARAARRRCAGATGSAPSTHRPRVRTVGALLDEARDSGLAAEMDLAGRSLKGQLRHAQRLGARVVSVIGPEEWERRVARVGDDEVPLARARRRRDRAADDRGGGPMSYRDMGCGEPRLDDAERTLTLSGWVGRRRDHGGLIFVDLRDRSGAVQLVIDPERAPDAHAIAHRLRLEEVVRVRGVLVLAQRGTRNPALATGDVELSVVRDRAARAGRAAALPARRRERRRDAAHPPPLPRPAPPAMQRIQKIRVDVTRIMRRYLEDRGFWELETPMLTRSTPEGARDFLVPARLSPGQLLRAAAEPAAVQAAAA